MTEIRTDPVTGNQVIIATERGKRPTDLKSVLPEKKVKKIEDSCPFCPGNEEKTPPEISRINRRDKWTVRVVPNKYPAVSMESSCNINDSILFKKEKGKGKHEVIIESREHNKSFFYMDIKEFEYMLKMYKKRYKDLINLEGIKYVSIFKNYKKEAGASLEHPHSQAIALPLVPKLIKEELHGSKNYFEKEGNCIYCDIIKEELNNNERIITETKNFLVLAPYASIYSYHTQIIPKEHKSNFETINNKLIEELAILLFDIFNRMGRLLGDFPFNMYLHTLPKDEENHNKTYHWHMEIAPRLSNQAGFELGSGMYINTVAPEQAAKVLRSVPTNCCNKKAYIV
ncbi:galactose-1-phosphate uridylyltransferase [Thermohalobacter berrensis]|uniref:Galactose-1-phosphate uridylyltransferase n=1 Tax=Thermohalobacter berrensis TaxID=99594 RepID=A0A419T5N4_9FIRM|nr:galactose-1-phosphate uridylyltransferase [Thermohalobacter berrensis]RKD32739.1 galactose-1-phosphate uridylyltransferase [Thermohalobacter berrensis]